MLDQQWDTAYLYETVSLENMRNLASYLADMAVNEQTLETVAGDIRQAIADIPLVLPMTVQAVSQHTTLLGNLVDRFINCSYKYGTGPLKERLKQAVLDYNHCQSSRERIWFRANNLDPDSSDLVSMQAMLFTDAYKYIPSR